MARNRPRFSQEHLDIERIEGHRQDTDPSSGQRFLGFTPHEVQAGKEVLLKESRRGFTMDIFGALEAAFRIDFLQRCYRREKDEVSRAFRRLHNDKGSQVSLQDDILAAWRQNSNVRPKVIEDLTSAFKYRHWLAHGRYWNPRFQKLDYDEVYALAEWTLGIFPFRGS